MGTMRTSVLFLMVTPGKGTVFEAMKPRISMSQSLARVTSSLKSTYSSPQSKSSHKNTSDKSTDSHGSRSAKVFVPSFVVP